MHEVSSAPGTDTHEWRSWTDPIVAHHPCLCQRHVLVLPAAPPSSALLTISATPSEPTLTPRRPALLSPSPASTPSTQPAHTAHTDNGHSPSPSDSLPRPLSSPAPPRFHRSPQLLHHRAFAAIPIAIHLALLFPPCPTPFATGRALPSSHPSQNCPWTSSTAYPSSLTPSTPPAPPEP